MKLSRLQRIIRLLTILQSEHHYKPDELATLLGVSRRTVFRDLDTLYQAGIPCYYDDDHQGYKVADNVFLPPLHLKVPEALALLLAARQSPASGLPLQDAAHDAACKIESSLPHHVRQHCAPVLQHTSTRLPAPARHQDLQPTLQLLQQAIRQQRNVSLDYISFHEKKLIHTTLSPYHLHFAQRAWYVIGRSSRHRDIRTFKLGRIKNAKLLDQRFSLDKPFSIESYFGDAWNMIPEGKTYRVALHFQPLVAANVAEVLWHKKQNLAWHDDGSLTFHVDVDGLGEISWWILGYGDQVEVLDPPELRERLERITQNMLKNYQKPPVRS